MSSLREGREALVAEILKAAGRNPEGTNPAFREEVTEIATRLLRSRASKGEADPGRVQRLLDFFDVDWPEGEDDESVGWDIDEDGNDVPMELTFGDVRWLRARLAGEEER